MKQRPDSQGKDLSIVLCGEAGQGVQTVERILVRALKLCGFHVFATKEYMSRVRGGMNSTEVRVSSHRVSAVVDRMDILLPFHPGAFAHLRKRLRANTVVIGDKENICDQCPAEIKTFIDVPFAKISQEIGDRIFVNVIAAAVVLGLLSAEKERVREFVRAYFENKSSDIIEKNLDAVDKGLSWAERIRKTGEFDLEMTAQPEVSSEILLNGAEAVGLGALAGGCNFLSSYPMSPSTGVMVTLAGQAEEADLIVEQAEDEISAINMALGASYAGARAMVTTSGGGFALMTEGISLAGMIETPVVVHLAQRPGPATGLPTRTEQGDLELVLFAGHGEFPRAVFAPRHLQDALVLTQKAFAWADKYQIPVFILTDQYFMDSYYNLPLPDVSAPAAKSSIVSTGSDYRRYALTADGISPRGIPGGSGLVGVDSDEHDEAAHITEDLDLRIRMVEKRMRRLAAMEAAAEPPELVGDRDYRVLVIGWGSTFPIIKESLEEISEEGIALLHFSQVYPLHPSTSEYLKAADLVVAVENNATCQFGRLIHRLTGVEIPNRILKYSGLPFAVEELKDRLLAVLDGEKPNE